MALTVACVATKGIGNAPRDEEEFKANAALISAAPEMLEALKRLNSEAMWRQEDNVGAGDFDRDLATARDAAAVAIAKAEGRA